MTILKLFCAIVSGASYQPPVKAKRTLTSETFKEAHFSHNCRKTSHEFIPTSCQSICEFQKY